MSWNNADNWQYSKWIYNIYRTMIQNPPSAGEETAVETFINNIWNVETKTGTRAWLNTFMNMRSVSQATDYIGDPDIEPYQVDMKVLGEIGRDFKKIPITSQEKTWSDTLIAATGNRKYGVYP